MERIRWRELVGVTHTKDEINDMCKEVDVLDGPNDEGEMFERPAKAFDLSLPKRGTGPRPNGGAYPPT
jgi:ubiquinol-cytochrome c reductase cytochrome c1 subunit